MERLENSSKRFKKRLDKIQKILYNKDIIKKEIDTMYFLRDEACTPIDLTEEEYSWMVGQLRAKRTADLKKAMTAYMETFGVAELRALVKNVTKEQ